MESNETFQIEFLSSALNDITEIISAFIMLGSKNGAIRMKDKINKAAQQLSVFPFSGVTVPDDKLARSGYRMIIIEKHLMFYRIFEDNKKVIIYRVFNGKINYPTLLNRMESDK